MSDDLVYDLEALGEDDFYYRPATTKATIDKAAAEITRLRAELDTTRRKGMEEAAKIALKLRDEWRNPEQRGGVAYAEAIAAAIRAAAKEGD